VENVAFLEIFVVTGDYFDYYQILNVLLDNLLVLIRIIEFFIHFYFTFLVNEVFIK